MQSSCSNVISLDSSRSDSIYLLTKELKNLLFNHFEINSDILVLCIGTDRSTGDCLGPLVGEKLSHYRFGGKVTIMGNLSNPIHAKNLDKVVDQFLKQEPRSLVIAVDASLGRSENIGKINLYNGPLFPGSGVNKKLPPVGDISITGIVNVSGFMEYMVLQSTRLSLVMTMANVISTAIFSSLSMLFHEQYPETCISNCMN